MLMNRLLVPLIVLILSSSTLLNPMVEQGDTLQYRVIKSNVSAQIDEHSVSVRGFNFNGLLFKPRTSVDVFVGNLHTGMDGTCSIGDNSDLFGYTDWMFLLSIENFVKRTSILTYSLGNLWAGEDLSKGVYFWLYPYIEPTNDNWLAIENIGATLNSTLDAYSSLGNDIRFNYIYEETPDQIYFETWNEGITNGTIDPILGLPFHLPQNCTFSNQFQISFAKDSGLMLGMRFKGYVISETDLNSIDVNMDYQIEKKGYNLPRFNFSSNIWSHLGFIAIYVLIPVILISLTVFLFRKRKRDSNTSVIEPIR